MKKGISLLASLLLIVGSFLPMTLFAADTWFRGWSSVAVVALPDSTTYWDSFGTLGLSDDIYANVTLINPAYISHALKVTKFWFTVPAWAIINGIEVSVEKSEGSIGTSRIQDHLMQLTKDDYLVWENKAQNTERSATDQVVVYGWPSDLWWETWTSEEINDRKFGAFFAAKRTSGTPEVARVDQLTIKVYYTETVPPVANPLLTQSCGLDIAYVIDRSGSIDATEMSSLKDALVNFTNTFAWTPTVFSLTTFDTTATTLNSFSMTPAQAAQALANISGQGVGETNRVDGLTKGFATLDPRPAKQNLIIFASDGNPTVPGSEAEALASAITEANLIKTAGTRILSVGIGLDADGINKMQMISGPSVDVGGANVDVISSTFGWLGNDLAKLATELCGGTITVSTYLQSLQTPAGANLQYSVAWTTQLTDTAGQTTPVDVAAWTYSITQQSFPSSFAFGSAVCRDQTNTIVGTPAQNGRQNITVDGDDIIHCDVIDTRVVTPPVCGNGILELWEQCDDHNNFNHDWCSARCTIEILIDNNDKVLTPVGTSDPDTDMGHGNT